jgi:hypothetical protein
MRYLSLISVSLVLAAVCLAPAAQAQSCDGGAYMNPQLFRGEAAYQSAVAEQEMHAFIGRAGLPQAPLYAIKKVDDITSSGRTPYCWVYTNQVTGLMSGYKLAVFNNEVVQPAVLAITAAGKAATDAGAVALKTLPPAEQKAVLDQLQRSKCFGTAASVEGAIAKAEGLCGNVEDVAPQATVGQQGLIAKASYAWDEQSWAGVVTREPAALGVSLKGLAGRSEKVHQARLVVVPTKATSVGFGLYLHASVPDATAKKAVAAFQGLTAPSKPLAVALDLGPQFSFVAPTAEQLEKMRAAIGLGK